MTKTDSALDALHTEERESALTFPCTFPIKVMGRTQDGFAQAVADVVRQARAGFRPGDARDARVQGGQLAVVHGDGQRELARAAR